MSEFGMSLSCILMSEFSMSFIVMPKSGISLSFTVMFVSGIKNLFMRVRNKTGKLFRLNKQRNETSPECH